jgi:hypothetical protein
VPEILANSSHRITPIIPAQDGIDIESISEGRTIALSKEHNIRDFSLVDTSSWHACRLGYNEFDFFLENEKYRPFDGIF